jgi:hypothetical protein
MRWGLLAVYQSLGYHSGPRDLHTIVIYRLRHLSVLFCLSVLLKTWRNTFPEGCNQRLQDNWLSIDRFVNCSGTAVSKNTFYTDWEAHMFLRVRDFIILCFTPQNSTA